MGARSKEGEGFVVCRRCGAEQLRGVDSFERISLADDPADPNCGHYYVDMVHVVRCAACGHRQENVRSEEHTSELQSLAYLVCRLLLEKKKKKKRTTHMTQNATRQLTSAY